MRFRPALRGACAGIAAAFLVALTSSAEKLSYPATRQGGQDGDTAVHHGVTVPDPYRWLEADPLESAEVAAWVEAQNRLSEAFLQGLPEREAIRRHLDRIWSAESRSAPVWQGGRYFSSRSDGRQERPVLYVQDSLLQEPRVLLDPNSWSADGSAGLTNFAASPDGRYLGYGVSAAGSDWQTYRILEIGTGRVLDEELRGIRTCCLAWTGGADAAEPGFYYGAWPDPAASPAAGPLLHHKIYYHRVGTPQSADRVVYEQPDHPDWFFFPHLTEDGRHLLLTVSQGDGKRFRILARDLAAPGSGFRELIPRFDNRYMLYTGSRGTVFYFRTDLDAPNGRLLAIDAAKPERESWRQVIAESDSPLAMVSLVGGSFLAHYRKEGRSEVKVFDLAGRFVRDVGLPGIGMVGGLDANSPGAEAFYSFSGWTEPPAIYRYDVASGRSTRLWRREAGFDPDRYEVRQVFSTSRDGTRVPLYLAHRKGLPLDGDRPTLLQGYGGFATPVSLSFSSVIVTWLEMGGVFAAPGLRGGSEYGESWHQAGMGVRKQNVFDDFLGAAQWLIDNRYTRPGRLAIWGTSNGGLLVGAALNQRPDLFAAAVAEVGLFDMLRYDQLTGGRAFVSEYGSAADPAEFKALHAYSPYHNVKDGTRYPAVFLITANHDNRVAPAHSLKFAARLQKAQAGDAPVLLQVMRNRGHGSGGRSTALAGITDQLAFLVRQLGMKPPEGFGKPPLH